MSAMKEFGVEELLKRLHEEAEEQRQICEQAKAEREREARQLREDLDATIKSTLSMFKTK